MASFADAAKCGRYSIFVPWSQRKQQGGWAVHVICGGESDNCFHLECGNLQTMQPNQRFPSKEKPINEGKQPKSNSAPTRLAAQVGGLSDRSSCAAAAIRLISPPAPNGVELRSGRASASRSKTPEKQPFSWLYPPVISHHQTAFEVGAVACPLSPFRLLPLMHDDLFSDPCRQQSLCGFPDSWHAVAGVQRRSPNSDNLIWKRRKGWRPGVAYKGLAHAVKRQGDTQQECDRASVLLPTASLRPQKITRKGITNTQCRSHIPTRPPLRPSVPSAALPWCRFCCRTRSSANGHQRQHSAPKLSSRPTFHTPCCRCPSDLVTRNPPSMASYKWNLRS